MGIIQRQSIKFSIVNAIGTFLGFLSVVFVYSLDKSLYGYFQSLHSFATLLVTLLGLGIQGVIIKFHPEFVKKGLERHFLAFTVVGAVVISILSLSMISLLYSFLGSWLREVFPNFSLFEENTGTILILSFLLLFSSIFMFHAASRYRIVVPDLIFNVGLKIFLPVIILLVYYQYIQESQFMPAVILYYFLVSCALFVYLMSLDRFSVSPALNKINRKSYASMFSFMVFAFLNSLGATFALKIDLAMIGLMLNKESVGLYAIIMTISNVMEIPTKAINQISGPVVSSNWANNDHANIQDVYQKSSVFGTAGGVFLFLLLFVAWPEILALMPGKLADYNQVIIVFVFLGGARLVDLATGINSVIISYSDQYRIHMYFLLFLGVLNAILNYFFLQAYGISGAAAATFLSYLLFNFLKYLYVSRKFSFSLNFRPHLILLLITCLMLVIFSVVPFHWEPIINLILKGVLVTLLSALFFWTLNPGNIRDVMNQSITAMEKFFHKL
ncbi:MAG: polysaccharide biosynthesis C-terminal domain-containing protein [Saprospiraceae bacterium]|nr:polysaccharide biosynthesis C-terminal domain-containing protein [Saprospiraceae bacterium]